MRNLNFDGPESAWLPPFLSWVSVQQKLCGIAGMYQTLLHPYGIPLPCTGTDWSHKHPALSQEGCIEQDLSTGQGQHKAACCRQHVTGRSVCRVICVCPLHLLGFKALSALRRKSPGKVSLYGVTGWILIIPDAHTGDLKGGRSPGSFGDNRYHTESTIHFLFTVSSGCSSIALLYREKQWSVHLF